MQPISFCFLNEDKSRHIVLMIVRFLWFPVPGGIILHQRSVWWSDYCGAMLKESHALQSHAARRSSERSCAVGEINLICVGGGGGSLSLWLHRWRRMSELVLTFTLFWIMSGDLGSCFKALGRNVKDSSLSALKESFCHPWAVWSAGVDGNAAWHSSQYFVMASINAGHEKLIMTGANMLDFVSWVYLTGTEIYSTASHSM